MATAARKRTTQTTKIPTTATTKPKPKAPRSDNLRVMPAPGALLLTVNETAYTLGIGTQRMYDLLARGELPSLMIGGCRRVTRRAVEAYMTAHPERYAEEPELQPESTCQRCGAVVDLDHDMCYRCQLAERRELHDQASYRALWLEQDGKCAICGKKSSRLVIDHNHKTGMVRGLLCNSCNTGLGQFADKPDRLRAAIGYLESGGIHDRQITYRRMSAARDYDPKDRRIRRRKITRSQTGGAA